MKPKLSRNRIGVFDSGIGGLTVLREFYRQLPHESILYFADTARLPYGDRSAREILQFVREILTWMTQQNVKMIVMACNTSSALALETVRHEFDIPILGLILPGARGAVQDGQRIGVIATPATADSDVYRQAILEINPQAKVWQVGCPEFVPLIEAQRFRDPYTKAVAENYLLSLQENQIDTLVYGCTHYGYLEALFQAILPSSVRYIDPANFAVKAAAQELALLGLNNLESALPTLFYVSGAPEVFVERSQTWLGFPPLVEQIHLPSLPLTSLVTEPSEQRRLN